MGIASSYRFRRFRWWLAKNADSRDGFGKVGALAPCLTFRSHIKSTVRINLFDGKDSGGPRGHFMGEDQN